MNSYAPVIEDSETVNMNKGALMNLGCTEAQAKEFSGRKFSALPKWLRKRIKEVTTPDTQEEPRKLQPKAGELAFYISSSRFPRMK